VTQTARKATARDETPLFFESAGETLFGILTSPVAEPSGTGVVLLTGGDFIPSLNRNRLWVRLARSLAAAGHHALRFDYHGVGESTGLVEHFELPRPFTDDLESAAAVLRSAGAREIVLVGVCFGAVTALASVERIEGLRGVAMLAHPVRDFELLEDLGTAQYLRHVIQEEGARGLLRRGKRLPTYASLVTNRVRGAAARARAGADAQDPTSRQLLDGLGRAARRRVPLLIVYGTEEGEGVEFEQARPGRLGDILNEAGDLIEVRTLEGNVHDLVGLDLQDAVLELTASWIERIAPVSAAQTTSEVG